MKLKEIEEKVLLTAIDHGIRSWFARHLRGPVDFGKLSIPYVEEIFAETKALEDVIKVLIEVFELKDSSHLRSVHDIIDLMKKQYDPDYWKELKKQVEEGTFGMQIGEEETSP